MSTDPTQPEPLSKLLPEDAAALEMAKLWGLVDADGQLWCSRNCGRPGLLPSLCCGECLAHWRQGDRRPPPRAVQSGRGYRGAPST